MVKKGILLKEEYGFAPKTETPNNSKKTGGNKNGKNKKESNK